jgi:hypothetical protein
MEDSIFAHDLKKLEGRERREEEESDSEEEDEDDSQFHRILQHMTSLWFAKLPSQSQQQLRLETPVVAEPGTDLTIEKRTDSRFRDVLVKMKQD